MHPLNHGVSDLFIELTVSAVYTFQGYIELSSLRIPEDSD